MQSGAGGKKMQGPEGWWFLLESFLVKHPSAEHEVLRTPMEDEAGGSPEPSLCCSKGVASSCGLHMVSLRHGHDPQWM